MTAWLNGTLTTDLTPDLDHLGFSLAEGLYEVIRVAGGRPLHLRRHWRRLRGGAAVLEMPMPYGDAALSLAIRSLLAEERVSGGLSVRVALTRGAIPRGFLPPRDGVPSVMITTAPLPEPPIPAELVVSTVTRRNEYSPLTRIKTLGTLDGLLARQEATRRGADDAVLLNSQGRIAGASASNLFFLIGDEIVTPPPSEGVLSGIRRQLAMECFPVVERPVTLEEALAADDIVMTTSLSLRAVASLEGRPLPQSGVLRESFAHAL
jgi:branched-chain amino acid aminotransferase